MSSRGLSKADREVIAQGSETINPAVTLETFGLWSLQKVREGNQLNRYGSIHKVPRGRRQFTSSMRNKPEQAIPNIYRMIVKVPPGHGGNSPITMHETVYRIRYCDGTNRTSSFIGTIFCRESQIGTSTETI